MNKRTSITFLIAIALANFVAVGMRYYFTSIDIATGVKSHAAVICNVVSSLLFVVMFMHLAKINLDRTPSAPKTALFTSFVSGFFGYAAMDGLFTLALK
jgi:hypothetical protein